MRQYQEIAFRVAFVITGSANDAEEVAQDAFVKAYFALDRFRPGAPFRPWLLQIVANEARNRRSFIARRSTVALNVSALDGLPAEESPEELLLSSERAEQLVSCLNALSEDDRRILTYRYFLDLSESEMASVLGVARGTIKSRLSRALSRARNTLDTSKKLNHE